MKIKRQKLVELYDGLLSVESLTGAKFSYAVARNISTLKREFEVVQEFNAWSKGFIKFEDERFELSTKHAVKVDGKPQTENLDSGKEVFVLKDRKAFDKAYALVEKKHKKAIDGRKKQLKELGKMLDKEVEINLYMIHRKHISEGINTKQVAAILPIIKE